MRVPAVARARQDRQVGKVALRHLDDAQHVRRIVQRHDQQLRLLGAGRAQHVGPRGIAEIHLGAEAAHHVHLAWIALQRGERDAVHAQHAADDLPEAAEAADDHRRVVRRRSCRIPAAARACSRGISTASDAGEQDRRGHHRGRGDQRGQRRVGRRQRAGGDGGGEQHEAEFAGLRQRQAEAQRVRPVLPAMRASTKAIADLGDQQRRGRRGEQQRLCARQRQIGRHADRDEEEAEQQALERLDVGLQFVAVFRFRQQHAGHEGAERWRQAGRRWRCSAVPATISSATVVNTSGVLAPPIARNSGRSRKRPPTRMTAIASDGARHVVPGHMVRHAVCRPAAAPARPAG